MKSIYFWSFLLALTIWMAISYNNEKNRQREIISTKVPLENYSIDKFHRGYRYSSTIDVIYNDKVYFVEVRHSQCCADSVKILKLYYDSESDKIFEIHTVNKRLLLGFCIIGLFFISFLLYSVHYLYKEKQRGITAEEINKQFAERKRQKKQKEFEKRRIDAERKKNRIR